MDEARRQRRWHAVGDAAVALPVTAGDQGCALGQLVLADLALEGELIKRGLDHGHGSVHLLEVDEEAAHVVARREEGWRRPLRAAGTVAPGNASQVDGIEQERADVDVFAAQVCCHLLGDHRFSRAWASPHHCGLAGLDEKSEGLGELAGAQRVVGGDGVGVGHGGLRANGCRGRSASGRSDLRRDRAPLLLSPVQGKPAGWMAPVLAMRKRSGWDTVPGSDLTHSSVGK